jgi:hypothetical protein
MLNARAGFLRLLEVLDRLAIRFMIAGSLASSAHGNYRSTNDIDIVAEIKEQDIARLVSELAGDFYADAETIRDAVRRGRSFNLIHFASSYKFDIFPLTGDPYSVTQLDRRIFQEVSVGGGDHVKCPVATPEDTILAKLVWYRLGGEQSERQWSDLRGIRSVQGSRLDNVYMQQWAAHMRVKDLLDRLLSEEL